MKVTVTSKWGSVVRLVTTLRIPSFLFPDTVVFCDTRYVLVSRRTSVLRVARQATHVPLAVTQLLWASPHASTAKYTLRGLLWRSLNVKLKIMNAVCPSLSGASLAWSLHYITLNNVKLHKRRHFFRALTMFSYIFQLMLWLYCNSSGLNTRKLSSCLVLAVHGYKWNWSFFFFCAAIQNLY